MDETMIYLRLHRLAELREEWLAEARSLLGDLVDPKQIRVNVNVHTDAEDQHVNDHLIKEAEELGWIRDQTGDPANDIAWWESATGGGKVIIFGSKSSNTRENTDEHTDTTLEPVEVE